VLGALNASPPVPLASSPGWAAGHRTVQDGLPPNTAVRWERARNAGRDQGRVRGAAASNHLTPAEWPGGSSVKELIAW